MLPRQAHGGEFVNFIVFARTFVSVEKKRVLNFLRYNPWNRVLLEKLTVSQLVTKCLLFYGT